jgi:hypothetical protein
MIAWLKKRIRQEMRRIAAREHYRPERHYMRGPGPKSAARSMPGTGDGNGPQPSGGTYVRELQVQEGH